MKLKRVFEMITVCFLVGLFVPLSQAVGGFYRGIRPQTSSYQQRGKYGGGMQSSYGQGGHYGQGGQYGQGQGFRPQTQQRGKYGRGIKSYYGQGQFSRYWQQQTGYESVSKNVAVPPRCIKEIDFVVQTPEANNVGDAIITYVDSGEIKTLITDKDGKATGKVTGCEVAVQVSADLYQPMQRMLDCCNNPLPTVVLELRPMCNFQVWFTAHEGDGFVYDYQYIDSLSYMYSTSSGGSGFGEVSVGMDTAPVCIHVNAHEASETLKFRVVGQGANSVNELVMSHFKKSDKYDSGVSVYGARMVLPAAVYEYDADDMFFTLYMNTWEEGEFDEEHYEYDSVYVYTSDGTEISSNEPYDGYYMTYSKSAVEDEGKVGEDLLIGFDMWPDGWLDDIRFYGNAALSDTDGNVTSAEAPSRSDWDDGGKDDWFPFCMCRGDTKEVKLVSTEYSVLDDFDPSIGNLCHFYLLCPCPMPDDSSLEDECSTTNLEEFFCGTSAFCEDCAPPSEITNWSLSDCP